MGEIWTDDNKESFDKRIWVLESEIIPNLKNFEKDLLLVTLNGENRPE